MPAGKEEGLMADRYALSGQQIHEGECGVCGAEDCRHGGREPKRHEYVSWEQEVQG